MNVVSSLPHWVVVDDPRGEFWEGAVVDATRARVLEARGACVMPCMPDLFRMSGCAGFSKRAWGAGLALPAGAPVLLAPLTMYLSTEARGVVWRCRLVPDGQRRERYEGFVRFAADSGQRSPLKGAYTEAQEDKPVMTRDLPAPDEDGGWTVGGKGLAGFSVEGHYGFGIYGTAPGLRVVWVAATTVPVKA
jgi:hypothetical protein